MPDISGGEYLIDYLSEIGECVFNGQGFVGVSHAEIQAYQKNVGFRLDSWEALTLHKLSAEYAQTMNRQDLKDPKSFGPLGKSCLRDIAKHNESKIFGG